ncbi:MAG: DUF1934 domain-containing protein, partial [Alicyclobacillus sp.]|nr:DUF1934 domain-containing protein [Alicyclobacillus sp.]
AWRCLYVPEAVVRHHRGATLGVASPRRIALIERNRVLLAVKHFPWDLLLLNPLFYAARLAAGAWAALRGRGEAGRIRGSGARLRLLAALLQGDLEALLRIPATLRKRRQLRPLRRMSNSEIRRLLWRHRIGLRELSEQAGAWAARTTLCIRPDAVTLVRFGDVRWNHTFRAGRRGASVLYVGEMAFPVEIDTRLLAVDVRPAGGRIRLAYRSDLGGVIQSVRLTIRFGESVSSGT